MPTPNQNPEQKARDHIDRLLIECGWLVQSKSKLNLAAGSGIAVTEYRTDSGPVDYLLFIDKQPVGVIEAKKAEEGVRLTQAEDQTLRYAEGKLKYLDNEPLHFGYESTGEVTRFTDYRDPKPRSRPEFSFHRPETLKQLLKEEKSLRRRLHDLPVLLTDGLRDCQLTAITNLEKSFKENRPKALIQMATGSGKTFTAITFIYRLLKFAKAKRILFLVDTRNLGEQAEQEFKRYQPQDDNRLFPELYAVTRLNSSFIPTDSQVYISTIQRLYSILKGTDLDERDEEENPEEKKWKQKDPMPVVYNERIPIEFFDFIIVDECHRSIYNLWKQVLDYFDAFQIGLTATPDNRTFGYFNQNLVCDYGYQKAVEDGVLVPYNVFEIITKVTQQGSTIALGEYVAKREKLTRRQFWEVVDEEDIVYDARQLDDKVVNPNQIRLIVRSVRDQLPVIFPDRGDAEGKFEVPKMLIFAKSDSHADDIINIVREEFAEENKFCKKITYRSTEDPKSVLQQFRNNYYPRIAVTVDMIATGTDIRPLEVLLFMRDVKSRTYYEQMKGRGTRTCSLEELRSSGTPAAKYTKDHFVIIDAIGVERSRKTDSRPLEKKPGMSLKEVLEGIHMGHRDEDMLSTLANRLIRLEKQISEKEKQTFIEKAGGKTITAVIKELLSAHDPDTIATIESRIRGDKPGAAPEAVQMELEKLHSAIVDRAVAVFNDYDLRNYVIDVRKKYDQTIDHINPDEIVKIGWARDSSASATSLVAEFAAWIEANKDEITALQIFYAQPYRRRELTYQMISQLFEALSREKPLMRVTNIWDAYANLEDEAAEEKLVKRLPRSEKPKQELTLLVSVVRKALNMDEWLNGYDNTVDRNFQEWVFRKQAGSLKFTEEQMLWLRMIKDYVAASFHVSKEDFDLAPFNASGGLGKFYQLFKEEYETILDELNEVLAA